MKFARTLILAGISVLLCSVLWPAPARAAKGASTATLATQAPQTLVPSVSIPKVGPLKIGVGLDSYNTFARGWESELPAGRRYSLKNEYYLTVTHESGWGLMPMAMTQGSMFGDSNRNAIGAGDSSLSLIHPNIKGDSFMVTGHVRKYFALTERSKSRELDHWLYYQIAVGRFGYGWILYNKFVPHYFDQEWYRPEDPVYYIEETPAILRMVTPWLRLGFGAFMQYESHAATPDGTSIEILPMLGFIPSSNLTIDFRYFMPVHKNNAMSFGPSAVTLDNSFAQVFVQLLI